MHILEIVKIELIAGHIGIMLITQMAKIKFTGGQIGFIVFI